MKGTANTAIGQVCALEAVAEARDEMLPTKQGQLAVAVKVLKTVEAQKSFALGLIVEFCFDLCPAIR